MPSQPSSVQATWLHQVCQSQLPGQAVLAAAPHLWVLPRLHLVKRLHRQRARCATKGVLAQPVGSPGGQRKDGREHAQAVQQAQGHDWVGACVAGETGGGGSWMGRAGEGDAAEKLQGAQQAAERVSVARARHRHTDGCSRASRCNASCHEVPTVQHALQLSADSLTADLVRQCFPHLLVGRVEINRVCWMQLLLANADGVLHRQ